MLRKERALAPGLESFVRKNPGCPIFIRALCGLMRDTTNPSAALLSNITKCHLGRSPQNARSGQTCISPLVLPVRLWCRRRFPPVRQRCGQRQCDDENRRRRNPQHGNRTPKSLLHLRRGPRNIVSARSASLVRGRPSRRTPQQETQRQRLHWKNTSSTNRNTHRTPMVCQYQAEVSTRICRISTRPAMIMPMPAAVSAASPSSRCAACVAVSR